MIYFDDQNSILDKNIERKHNLSLCYAKAVTLTLTGSSNSFVVKIIAVDAVFD